MTRPSLTFACELDAARLTELFADAAVTDDLKALGARVMIMVSDLSTERACVVQQLNQAGIPLVGIPLFPVEEGYYFTVDNAPRAAQRYEQWKQWTAEHGLVWDWVGLDLEPEAQLTGNGKEGDATAAVILRPQAGSRVAPRGGGTRAGIDHAGGAVDRRGLRRRGDDPGPARRPPAAGVAGGHTVPVLGAARHRPAGGQRHRAHLALAHVADGRVLVGWILIQLLVIGLLAPAFQLGYLTLSLVILFLDCRAFGPRTGPARP